MFKIKLYKTKLKAQNDYECIIIYLSQKTKEHMFLISTTTVDEAVKTTI